MLKKFSMPSPAEMDHLIKFCQVMATSKFYQTLGAGGVLAIYLTAHEYNLPFMSCLNGGLTAVEGKVTFAAIMINALIENAGGIVDILHLDEEKCTLRFKKSERHNDKSYVPLEYTYTIEQAKKAGYLTKNNWKTSPKDMLYCRCLTGGGRKHFPGVFVGVLVQGELIGTDSDSEVDPIVPAELSNQSALLLDTIPEAPKQIEDQKREGYDLFLNKKFFEHGQSIIDYMAMTAIKAKKSEIHTWNQAIENPVAFEKCFIKWKADQPKDVINENQN